MLSETSDAPRLGREISHQSWFSSKCHSHLHPKHRLRPCVQTMIPGGSEVEAVWIQAIDYALWKSQWTALGILQSTLNQRLIQSPIQCHPVQLPHPRTQNIPKHPNIPTSDIFEASSKTTLSAKAHQSRRSHRDARWIHPSPRSIVDLRDRFG